MSKKQIGDVFFCFAHLREREREWIEDDLQNVKDFSIERQFDGFHLFFSPLPILAPTFTFTHKEREREKKKPDRVKCANRNREREREREENFISILQQRKWRNYTEDKIHKLHTEEIVMIEK